MCWVRIKKGICKNKDNLTRDRKKDSKKQCERENERERGRKEEQNDIMKEFVKCENVIIKRIQRKIEILNKKKQTIWRVRKEWKKPQKK